MTRAEFDAIHQRMSAELSRFTRRMAAGMRRLSAERVLLTADDIRQMKHTARKDHARMLAACDQYDAAAREVPPGWLPVEKRAP